MLLAFWLGLVGVGIVVRLGVGRCINCIVVRLWVDQSIDCIVVSLLALCRSEYRRRVVLTNLVICPSFLPAFLHKDIPFGGLK